MAIENPDSQTQLSQSLAVIEAVRRLSQRLLATWQQSDPVSALDHTLADILLQVDEEVISDQKISAAVYVYDEDEGFSNGQMRGPLHEYMKQYRPRKGGTGEYAIQTKQPLFVGDVTTMPPDVPPLSQQAFEQGVRAFANLPLLIGEKEQETLVGLLIINLQQSYDFNEERQAILRLFADQAAIALQNARVHRRRLREQEALQVISESASSGQPGEVGQIIAQKAVELTRSTYATFWAADLPRSQLVLQGVHTQDPEWQPPHHTLPIDERSINGYVALNQKEYYAPRPDTDPYYARWNERIKAAFCVPLIAREELVGTLYVAGEKENGIGPTEQRFIKRLAPLAAVALQNASFLQLEQQQRRQSETLRKVAEIVNSTLALDEVIGSVLDQLVKVIAFDSASVQLIRGDRRIMVGSRGFWADDSPPELLRNISEDQLISRVVESQKPVVLSDVATEPLWDHFPATAQVNSWIGAPLVVKDKLIGLLTMDHHQAGAYTPESGEVVAAFANQVAVAIRNAELYNDLEVLNQSVVKLAQAHTTESAYQAILDVAVETLGCDHCTLFLADADGELVAHSSGGRLLSEDPDFDFAPGEGLAGWVYQHGEPLLVANTAEEIRFKSLLSAGEKLKPRSIVLSPLRRGQKIIGVISADLYRPDTFDENALRLLSTVTLYADSMLQNIDFYRDFRTIHDATNNLARQPALDEVYQAAVASVLETLPCRHSTIFILNKKIGELVAEKRAGAPQDAPQVRHFKLGEGLAGYVAQTGQPVMVNDVPTDKRFVKGNIKPHNAPRSMVLAPIKIQDEVVGVISADKDEIGGFTKHNLEMLETLALDVGLAINLRRQQDSLRAIAEFQWDIAEVLPVQTQLERIYSRMSGLMDTSSMFIALCDEELGLIRFPLVYERGQPIAENLKSERRIYGDRPFGQRRGLTEWVLRHHDSLLVENADIWPEGRDEIEPEFLQNIKCCLLAPALIQDRIVAVIGLQSFDQPGVFSEADRDLLETIAQQAAVALENARLIDVINNKLARKINELEAVSEFQRRISDIGSVKEELEDIYNAAAGAMSGIMDTRNMYIALYDEDTATIEFPLAYEKGRRVTDEETIWGLRRFGDRQGLTEWVIRYKEPLLVERDFDAWVEAQADIEAFPLGTKCWLGTPMMLREKVIGVIGLQNFEQENVFNENHRNLLMTIASQAAIAIDNARQYDLINNQLTRRIKELEAVSKFQQKISGFVA